MNINRVKEGTQLMWDAPPNPYSQNPENRFVYPVTIGERHHDFPWRMVYFNSSNSQWMGPEVEQIREPTRQELKELTWPVTRYNSPKTSK